MRKIYDNSRTRALLSTLAVSLLVTLNTATSVHAYTPQNKDIHSWSTPPFPTGERLEIIRDDDCFGEQRTSNEITGEDELTTEKTIRFQGKVISAEVFLSGYNMWYTREGHDHEVLKLRVDAELTQPPGDPDTPQFDPHKVNVLLKWSFRDEDTSDDDDFANACIGFTVFALMRP